MNTEAFYYQQVSNEFFNADIDMIYHIYLYENIGRERILLLDWGG